MFGQVESVSFGALGSFVVMVGAALGFVVAALTIAVLLRQLFTKADRPEREKLVTHADLEIAVKELSYKIENTAPRESVTAIGTRLLALEQNHTKLEEYSHKSIHRMNNKLQSIDLKLERVLIMLGDREAVSGAMKPDKGDGSDGK